MRLIATLKDPDQAKVFSAFLTDQGIDNQCEIVTNQDENSSDFGKIVGRIWIFNEDHVEAALKWYEKFQYKPNDQQFKTSITQPPEPPSQTKPPKTEERLGSVTLYTLILCTLLFFATELTRQTYIPISTSIPFVPVFSSPIKKAMLYDYPHAYSYIDKIVSLFGIKELQHPNDLPAEGKLLLQKYLSTSYWHGIYDIILQKTKTASAPMFEKIQQGELWRLFSPCLLHADIFHLFFNMIWLIVIGKQIEKRIGAFRYLLFFLITGIVSNTAQYIMSGANFIGFSGILCAMIVFVWVRQQKVPWEGYFMQPATWAFILFFVLLMLGIQLISFIFQLATGSSFSPNIANTAHITGGFMGYILGRLSIFKSQQQSN